MFVKKQSKPSTKKRFGSLLASSIDMSFPSWIKTPAQNASPAPVVSTTCTLCDSTLPLNFCILIKKMYRLVLQLTLNSTISMCCQPSGFVLKLHTSNTLTNLHPSDKQVELEITMEVLKSSATVNSVNLSTPHQSIILAAISTNIFTRIKNST
jgi:hypothetical protein